MHPKDSGLRVIKGVPSAAAEEPSWPKLARVEILLNNHSEVGQTVAQGRSTHHPSQWPAMQFGSWAVEALVPERTSLPAGAV